MVAGLIMCRAIQRCWCNFQETSKLRIMECWVMRRHHHISSSIIPDSWWLPMALTTCGVCLHRCQLPMLPTCHLTSIRKASRWWDIFTYYQWTLEHDYDLFALLLFLLFNNIVSSVTCIYACGACCSFGCVENRSTVFQRIAENEAVNDYELRSSDLLLVISD